VCGQVCDGKMITLRDTVLGTKDTENGREACLPFDDQTTNLVICVENISVERVFGTRFDLGHFQVRRQWCRIPKFRETRTFWHPGNGSCFVRYYEVIRLD
jgi:hypothetical protein